MIERCPLADSDWYLGCKMSCGECSDLDGSMVHSDGEGLPGTDLSSECNALPEEPVDEDR